MSGKRLKKELVEFILWKPAVSFGRVAAQCKASGIVYCNNLFHKTVRLSVKRHRAVTGRHHHVTSSCNTGLQQEMNLSLLVLVKTMQKLFDQFYNWYPQDYPRSKKQMGIRTKLRVSLLIIKNQLAKSRPVSFDHLYGNSESASFLFFLLGIWNTAFMQNKRLRSWRNSSHNKIWNPESSFIFMSPLCMMHYHWLHLQTGQR